MFSVIFEVLPNKENWDDYLDDAKMLRPELEQVEGFVDNIRYKSLTREGWILSLSNWRDEKSLVRWRTSKRHHEAQQKGRDEILADYHLRVGQITADNQVPVGYALTKQRLDETEVGEGTTITLINATRPAEWKQTNNPYDCAEWLGLNPWAADSTSWDIFDAILTPGKLILIISWKDAAAAQAYEDTSAPNDKARVRSADHARLREIRPSRGASVLRRRQGRRNPPRLTPLRREGPTYCEFDPAFTQARAVEEPGSLSRVTARNTIKETRRNDERSGRARRRGIAEIPGSANSVARLVPHRVRLEHRSGLAAFDWAVARSVLRCRPVGDQRLRAHPH
jgi:heme-degrading monooxygenase HmoA